MTPIGNNTRVRPDGVPVQRSPGDYLLLRLLFAWGILFLLAVSTTLNRSSSLAFLAASLPLYLVLVLHNVYRSLNPIRTPILQNPLTQLGVDIKGVIFPAGMDALWSVYAYPKRPKCVAHPWDRWKPAGSDASCLDSY
jgi:hypothetical protein